MSMKNSNDIIGNRTRDLPASSAVPQPIAPPRGPKHVGNRNKQRRKIVHQDGFVYKIIQGCTVNKT
jgi:hypothetical protein